MNKQLKNEEYPLIRQIILELKDLDDETLISNSIYIKLNILDDNDQLKFFKNKNKLHLLKHIKNPSDQLQKYIVNNELNCFEDFQKIDLKYLIEYLNNYCINDEYIDDYEIDLINPVIYKFFSYTEPTYDNLSAIIKAYSPCFLSCFQNLNEELQVKLVKLNYSSYNYLKNPCENALLERLYRNNEDLFSHILRENMNDKIYEKFFHKNIINITIPNERSIHFHIPKHIIQKYIKHFNSQSIDEYARSMLRKNRDTSPEFISFLYDHVKSKAIKKKILESSKYLDPASLVLKQFNDQALIEKKNFIKNFKLNNNNVEKANNALELIANCFDGSNFDENKIIDIIYSFKEE